MFFFLFSFFSVVSRFVSPLCFPIVFPVALPRRWVEVLEPIVEKMMSSKKTQKSVIFHFFLRFEYRQYFQAIK